MEHRSAGFRRLSDGAAGRRKLQQIAVSDVAGFAAEVIAGPEEFAGQHIDIASEERTGTEAAAILGRASGREIKYLEIPLEQTRAGSEDLAARRPPE